MLKKCISYLLTVTILLSMMTTVSFAATRAGATGAPFTVAAEGESVMYLWENVDSSLVMANDADTDKKLRLQNNGSAQDSPWSSMDEDTGMMYVNKAGAEWSYTVTIPKTCWYQLDIIGSSGWVSGSSPSADGGGRLSITFSGDNAVTLDTSAVVLPSWGGGGSIPEFAGHTAYTKLGAAEFQAGTYTMTMKATKINAFYRKLKFTPVEPVVSLVGEPINIAATEETAFYAAENVNIDDKSDVTLSDIIMGKDATEESLPDNVVIGTEADGTEWSYKLNVAESGVYQVAVLGYSGYSASAENTDGGGRFEMTFDYKGLIDGVGASSVVLPPWGDGKASASTVPAQQEFTDEDRVILGTIGLSKGSHTMIMKAVAAASGLMRFKKIYFIPVAGEALPYIKIDARAYDEVYLAASEEDETGVINNTTYYTSGIAGVRGPSTWSKVDADNNSWYMEYSFDVETAGEYWVGVRSAIVRGNGLGFGEPATDNPTVSVTLYGSDGTNLGTGTYKSAFCPQKGDGTGLFPRNNAGVYNLTPGSYKIRIHGASYSTYFQAIELWPLAAAHQVSGLGKNSFSALEVSPQEGSYTIDYYNGATEGEKYVKLPNAWIDGVWNRSVYWDIYVAEGDEGWYDIWFNAATPGNTTNSYWGIGVDGVQSEWFYGQAGVAKPGAVLPETNKTAIYLTEGFHTVGFYPITGGGNLHIQTVNLQVQDTVKAHDVSATEMTRIMATEYSDKSHRQPIVNRNVNLMTGARGMYCMGENSAKQNLTFTVDVAEGGWYKPSLGICAWNYTTDTNTYTWYVTVNDAENPVTVTAAADKTYTPDTDADGNPLAKRYAAEGCIYLPAGRHTITAYTQNGKGQNTYLHCIELVKDNSIETPIDVSGSMEISALDYDGFFGGLTSVDWRASGTETALHFNGGPTWFYKRGAVYRINVDEAAAGTYNIGIKAVKPNQSGTAQILFVTVDGVDAGFVEPETLPAGTVKVSGSVGYTPIDPSTHWARPVNLTAGTHEIIVSGLNHYPMYMEGLVLEKAEETYSAQPQTVVYNRDENAEPGIANGSVTITPPSDSADIAAYHLYWGDENGRLEDYTAFGFQPVSDASTDVTYRIRKGIVIPEGATRILVYPVKKVSSDYGSSLVESSAYMATELPEESLFGLNEDEKLFSLWVVSDTHFAQPDWTREVDNTTAINDMLAVDNQALGLFGTGDITNDGFLSDWLSVKEVYDATLGQQNIPFYIIPGNHDTGAQSDYASAEEYYLKYASYLSDGRSENEGNAYYWFKEKDAYFVFLADEGHGTNYGMTSTQLDWLEGVLKLADAENAPVFMFNHYSPSYVDVGLRDKEAYSELNARFQEMISSRKNIVYFYGHQHFAQAYYYGTSINGSEGSNVFGSNTIVLGYGPLASVKVDQYGTEYSNVFTNYIEGHLVDVYNGYVVVRGRSFSTHEWEGFDTFLIRTDYSAANVSREGNTLTIEKNPNYTEEFSVIVATYNGDVLESTVTVSSEELSANGAKTVTLSTDENRKVKVFTWSGTDKLQPVRIPIEY